MLPEERATGQAPPNLLIDVGNSSLKFRRSDRIGAEAATSRVELIAPDFESQILKVLNSPGIGKIGIACVVQGVRRKLRPILESIGLDFEFFDLPWAEKRGLLGHQLDSPQTFGADRLCAVIAAGRLCPPNSAVIVLDMGSATTLTVAVPAERVGSRPSKWNSPESLRTDSQPAALNILGGAIAAGPSLLASAAAQGDQLQLPQWNNVAPAIGNSTRTALEAGLKFGYFGICRQLVVSALDLLNESKAIDAARKGQPAESKLLPGVPPFESIELFVTGGLALTNFTAVDWPIAARHIPDLNFIGLDYLTGQIGRPT